MARGDGQKLAVLPVAYPPLDRQRCKRCDRLGVTVVAMWTTPDPEFVPYEALFCSTACAGFAGWPWLDPEEGRRKRDA